MRTEYSLIVAALWVSVGVSVAAAVERPAPERWAKEMDAFAAADRDQPVPAGGIVFVGSSSIRLWDLAESFPLLRPLNRGFGGSNLADTVHYLEVLVCRHQPRAVVVYAGDNDIAQGLTPEQVAEDFRALNRKLHATLPRCELLYIAIKPSVARWELYPQMRRANELIAAECSPQSRSYFVDIATPMLDGEGPPRPELFVEDGLHLNHTGYGLWTKILQARLNALVPPAAERQIRRERATN